MIRLITDSGADRNELVTAKYDMPFVPLTIILDDKEYLDSIDISISELHDYMKAGNFPKTSQINPQLAIEAFEAAAEAGDDVIFISIFSQLSGTYQVAVNAMNFVKEKYPDFKCEVVDSKTGAGGQTLLFLSALELIKRDYDFETILKQIHQNVDNMVTYLAVDDMNWLAKGGRLPKSVGKIGSMLKVKPLLYLDENGVAKDSLVRGKKRVYVKMIDKLLKQINHYDDQSIVISHVDKREIAEELKAKVLEELPNANVYIFEISTVIAAHVGIGGIGIFALTEKPENFYPISI